MSSPELEDRMDRERDAAVARQLGLTVEEADDLDYTLDHQTSADGDVIGHILTFGPAANPAVIAKLRSPVNGQWIAFGLDVFATDDRDGEEP